jgi:hypothetical protein
VKAFSLSAHHFAEAKLSISATGRLDQTHRAVGQLHPRSAHSQDAFMLEEVKVPIGLGHGVMDRMQALLARYGKAGSIHSEFNRGCFCY